MRKICAAVVALSLLLVVPAVAQSPAPPDIERRVESILSRMTIEEKIDLIGGVDDFFIRGYERARTQPLFPFGHGLSYTTFKYGYPGINPVSERAWGDRTTGPKFEVSFDVKNTGARAGADVAQIYVGERNAKVPRPTKELKGFVKVFLRPGETKRVTVMLDGRAFSYYDVASKRWRAQPGEFDVYVGRSSAQIELRDKLTLPARGMAATQ